MRFAQYDFDYFSSANVVIYMGNFPILDAVGLSVSINESKLPLYGYASRHFDAVARGQVLATGVLVINYIHEDYLYKALEAGRNGTTSLIQNTPTKNIYTPEDADTIYKQIQEEGLEKSTQLISQLTEMYWNAGNASNISRSPIMNTVNLHDLGGAVEIKVIFGSQGGTAPNGETGYLLDGVHFTGRGKEIQVSPDVIVESYPFFARNFFSLKNPYRSIGQYDIMPDQDSVVLE